MQTLLSNFALSSFLSRSLFTHFGKEVENCQCIVLVCVSEQTKSVCWHKMKTKTKRKEKKIQTLLKLKKQMTILVVGQHIISKAGPQVMIPLHETIARSSRN